MKICFDGLAVSRLKGTGLYTYSFELLNQLLESYGQPQYHLIWEGNAYVQGWQKKKNLTYSNIGINRKENIFSKLDDYLAANRVDLFHSPNNGLSIPFTKACKFIITVHDLYPVSNRCDTDVKYCNKFESVFPNAIRKADAIIAVSDFIKMEIIKNYRIPDKKIAVIHPGCSHIFRPLPAHDHTRVLEQKYGIKEDFVLFAGSIHPRKNLDKAIKIFKAIMEYRDDLKLVIAGKVDGKREGYYQSLRQYASRLQIEDAVLFPGIVDYEDMPAFYNRALCMLNLSDYEGYPSTTVEAIACNTPVICSKLPVFEEVAGTAAILADPRDHNLIKDVLLGIICNADYRRIAEKKYGNNATDKTWEGSIKKVVSLYESIVYNM